MGVCMGVGGLEGCRTAKETYSSRRGRLHGRGGFPGRS